MSINRLWAKRLMRAESLVLSQTKKFSRELVEKPTNSLFAYCNIRNFLI